MSEEIVSICNLRLLLVGARADLRVAQDALKRAERSSRSTIRATLARDGQLAATASERERQIEDLVLDSEPYVAALRGLRSAEKRAEQVQANLENVQTVVRQEEWLIREKLADAIADYGTRECLGAKDHLVVDTLIDATGEDGVFAGESKYVRDATRIA